jgi:hypothetical protein
MAIILGPVLTREGGYAFDAWTPEDGLTRGYLYRRIEDAYYARRAGLTRPGEGDCDPVVACNTVDEFAQATTVLETTARSGSRPAA